MLSFACTHRIAILVALLVGSITVAPSIIAPLSLGSAYQGVQFLPIDDEEVYRARIHEITDGYPRASSPYFLEYKNADSPMATINDWVYALPAFVLGLSAVIVMSKFLFPALLFLLVYLLVRRIIGEQSGDATLAAVLGGLLVVLGYDLIDYRTVLEVLSGTAIPSFPVWTRLVNPIVGALLFFGFLHALWSMVERKKYAYVGTGILIALSVGYFFNFALALAITGSLFLVAFLQKNYTLARECAYAIGISVVLDAWYWYSTLTAIGGEAGKKLALLNGMFFTHDPVINMLVLATTLFFLGSIFLAWKQGVLGERRFAWGFMVALLFGSWVAFNHQIITGRTIWYYHFVQYVIPLCLVVGILVLHSVWRPLAPRLWRIAMVLLAVFVLGYGVYGVLQVKNHLPAYERLQNYATVFEYLADDKECVVMILDDNEVLERLIPAYTDCNTYTSTYVYFGVPQERILHNYLFTMKIKGISPKEVRAYIDARPDLVRSYFFSDWDQMFGRDDGTWFADTVAYIEDEYAQFEKGNMDEQFTKYQLDHIISKQQLETSVLDMLPTTVVEKKGEFFFYSF